ncbi:hypothetical protein Aau02nite_53170 [Amorphoplanes auranticolor]|uniref:Uncharacterized protein n=1 Tax=Actinoplanes auranticolor TaxID=47988 RepID=A0A919SHJ0_9ACTN|nr:hypothetical protein Aau02nite_53170 [Actinoplanes auranticolor]
MKPQVSSDALLAPERRRAKPATVTVPAGSRTWKAVHIRRSTISHKEAVRHRTTVRGRRRMGLTHPGKGRRTHVAPDAMNDAEGHGNS